MMWNDYRPEKQVAETLSWTGWAVHYTRTNKYWQHNTPIDTVLDSMASLPSPALLLAFPLVSAISSATIGNLEDSAMVPLHAFYVTYSTDARQAHRSDRWRGLERLIVADGAWLVNVYIPNSRPCTLHCEPLSAIRALIGRCSRYRMDRDQQGAV